MSRVIRAVEDGEVPSSPEFLEDALDLGRRAVLARARLELARVIDAGVPPHALARLVSELTEIDSQIRALDGEDVEGSDVEVADSKWRPEAI